MTIRETLFEVGFLYVSYGIFIASAASGGIFQCLLEGGITGPYRNRSKFLCPEGKPHVSTELSLGSRALVCG